MIPDIKREEQTMKPKIMLKYEDSLKNLIIAMLESGELSSIEQARKRFQIPGHMTIQRWLKRAGKEELLPVHARRTLDLELDRTKEYDSDLHNRMLRTLELEKKRAKAA